MTPLRRRMAEDMQVRNLSPCTQATRFRGTCYRAANWIHVGHTQGRGKLGVHHRSALPVKHILLKPLNSEHRRSGHRRRCQATS
ncbi:MAG: DUF4338 domain-containing protein, partial [Bryobacterales bacterium]|nr:DUF4338 domain-containing protein [Bryobacterales bacterium]